MQFVICTTEQKDTVDPIPSTDQKDQGASYVYYTLTMADTTWSDIWISEVSSTPRLERLWQAITKSNPSPQSWQQILGNRYSADLDEEDKYLCIKNILSSFTQPEMMLMVSGGSFNSFILDVVIQKVILIVFEEILEMTKEKEIDFFRGLDNFSMLFNYVSCVMSKELISNHGKFVNFF